MAKTFHLGQSVEGALRNYSEREFDRMFRGVFTDADGRAIPTREAREKLWKLHGQGVKVLPMGDCPCFDPVYGCPGHEEPAPRPSREARQEGSTPSKAEVPDAT